MRAVDPPGAAPSASGRPHLGLRVATRLEAMPATAAPITIDIERDRGVVLAWADGTTSRFGLEELRQQCPCAECRNRRDRNQAVWPLPSSPQPLRIVNAELVGAWGISITWNDGHSTGIYSWSSLRPDGDP